MAPTPLTALHGINDKQVAIISAFIQGAVHCWGMNHQGEWFALPTLLGRTASDWAGTPLLAVYQKHLENGGAGGEAVRATVAAMAELMQKAMSGDLRFESRLSGAVTEYRSMRA